MEADRTTDRTTGSNLYFESVLRVGASSLCFESVLRVGCSSVMFELVVSTGSASRCVDRITPPVRADRRLSEGPVRIETFVKIVAEIDPFGRNGR